MKLALLLLIAALAPSPQERTTFSGYVLEVGTGRPISGANLTIGGEIREIEILRTRSQADGYFRFENVAPGGYAISVEKGGYMLEQYTRSQRAVTITRAGRTDFILRLLPTGALAGKILGSNGQPIPEARVRVFQFAYSDVQREPTGFQGTYEDATDDRGEFRVFDVPAGMYFLVVDSPNRGSAALFPGDRELRRAQRVEVRGGTDTRLADFTLPPPFPGKIRVRVVNATGSPLPQNFGNRIGIVPAGWDVITSGDFGLLGRSTGTTPGIDLELRPRLLGSFVLYAAMQTAVGNVAGYSTVEYSGGDIDVEFVVAKLAAQIKGRVFVDSAGTLKPFAGAEMEFYGASAESAFSDADGVFNIRGLFNGPFRFSGAFEMPKGYYVASIREGERDLLKEPLMVSEQTPEVEVRVRSDGGLLEGKVSDSLSRATQNAVVAMVPQSLLEVRSDRHNTYRIGHTDEKGAFELHDIIPGEYLIYVWSNLEESAVMDPLFLERYRGKGLLVKVDGNAKLKMDLTILDE
jgi:hypothetical protein